ncbi:hypothetical protein CsSME_00011636 [Camellia sinensis var. sinensis]
MTLIWVSGRQPGLIYSEPIRRSTDYQAQGTVPETIEATEQYAQGFLMFLIGTILFSNRGNTLWVCAYFPTLALDPEVETPLKVPYSCRFEGQCRPRPRETLPYLRHYFDTGFLGSSLLGHGAPPDTGFYLRDQLAEPGFSGSASYAKHWTCGAQRVSLPRRLATLCRGEYTTYLHTYLMPPLTGVRAPMRRAADIPSSSHARATDIPSTSRASTSRDPPTELTCWWYGTPYQIPLEPSFPDHRYVRAFDSASPSTGYVEGLLEAMASLEFLVLRRETMLHSHGISVLSSFLVTPLQPRPPGPSRVAGRRIPTRGRERRRAPARRDDESREEEELENPHSGSEGRDDTQEDSEDGGSGSDRGADGGRVKAAQPKRVKMASRS